MSVQEQQLPHSGQISFPELTSSLGDTERLLGAPPNVEHRLVAYRDKEGRWVVYASGLYVGFPISPSDPERVQLGSLSLISNRGIPSDVDTPEKFTAFVHSWPRKVGHGELRVAGFGQSVNVDRVGSDQGYLGYPCWRSSLYYVTSSADFPPPAGPFFDESSGHFAERAADAAVSWLNDELYQQGSMPTAALRLVVADPRAMITRFVRTPESVSITVFGTRPNLKLNIVVQTVGYGGVREPPISARVVGHDGARSGTVPVSAPFQRFRALLFGTDGEVYDEVNESIARPSARGYELFGISPSSQDIDLAHALTTGESDTVECKEWMPTDILDGKANELLKSVCAFANGKGGSIYIGVSRQLEVRGTDRPLRTWHHKESPREESPRAQNMEAVRAEYTHALRSRIADGISPSVPIEIEWIEYAGGEHVCRIRVHGSGQLIHFVISTNDIYVRRGANSRKARPEELSGNALQKRAYPELELF